MWLKSVSKTVFFLMAFTVCAAFMTGILPVKDFVVLASMAFSFFFGIKQASRGQGRADDIKPEEKKDNSV